MGRLRNDLTRCAAMACGYFLGRLQHVVSNIQGGAHGLSITHHESRITHQVSKQWGG
jgi:hypothetical protein